MLPSGKNLKSCKTGIQSVKETFIVQCKGNGQSSIITSVILSFSVRYSLRKIQSYRKLYWSAIFDLLSKFVKYLSNAVLAGAPLQLLCHLELNSGLALARKYHRDQFKNRLRVKFQYLNQPHAKPQQKKSELLWPCFHINTFFH